MWSPVLWWMRHSGPGSEALAFTCLCGNVTIVLETWLYCVVQFIPSYTIKAAIPLSQPPKWSPYRCIGVYPTQEYKVLCFFFLMLTYSLDCQIVRFYLNAPQPPTPTPSVRILFGQFHSQEFGAGWRCVSTIPVLGELRREAPEFDASPGYLMRPPSQKNWEREKRVVFCFINFIVLLLLWTLFSDWNLSAYAGHDVLNNFS